MSESNPVGTSKKLLPKYKCHKEVYAMKIKAINYNSQGEDESDGSATLIPDDESLQDFTVDGAYMEKHKPKVGGYFVIYTDGYRSFSPAEAFEDGYTKV